MKAVIFSQYGTPADLQFTEVERPSPSDNEVLVEVHAASVNSWDYELLQGTSFDNRLGFGLFRPTKINTLGCDIAGRVVAIGKHVSKFKPGDEVYGDLSAGSWGGYAEYLCANEKMLRLKPTNMNFEQAALLAWQGLRKGGLRSGQRYDLILDAQAYHTLADYRRALKPGGCYVVAGGSLGLIFRLMLLGPLLSRIVGKRMTVLLHKANKGLADVEALFAAGKIAPEIYQRYPLRGVPRALADFGAGKVVGKAVIVVKSPSTV